LFLFTLTLFMMFITYRYTDEMCLSVYSRDHENCLLLNGTIYGIHYMWVYDRICLSVYFRDYRNCASSPKHYSRCSLYMDIPMECVCQYISETMGIVHFLMTLFTMFITYGYIDGICPPVYSRDHEKCSLLNAVIINDLLTIHCFSVQNH